MAPTCNKSFDEELLSGYLDGALPQGQSQRVRLHLAECNVCRQLHQDLLALRQSALSTRFAAPADEEWPELPRTRVSWIGRTAGWTLILVWTAVVTTVALWRFLSQAGDPFEVFLVLGLPGGFVLLFASALLDRLRDLKTDRYRGVQR